MNRRRFVRLGSTVALGTLAGCSSVTELSSSNTTTTRTFEPPYEWRFTESADYDVEGIAVTDRRIFGSANDLHAIDRETGAEQWRYDHRGCAPAVHEEQNLVFAYNEYGLTALSTESGERQWRGPTVDLWFETTPIVRGDTAFFGDSAGKLLAVDVVTGDRVWQRQVADEILGLTVTDGMVYTVDYGGAFNAFDAATGANEWTHSLGSAEIEVGDDPVVAGDTIYVVGTNKEIRAIDRGSTEIRWKKTTDHDVTGVTLANGTLFVTVANSRTGTLLALDPATGSRRFRVPNVNAGVGPTEGDTTLYVGTREFKDEEDYYAHLYGIDPDDGTTKAALELQKNVVSEPIVTENTVYFGTETDIVAVAKDELLT